MATRTPIRLLPESERLVEIGVRLGLTLVVALMVQRGLFMIVGRIERVIARTGHGNRQVEQRAKTLGQLLRSLCTAVVAAGALIHALEVLGWDVKPLLAGAGILGVALGFGAQTLVRDLIAGFFVLAENQYGVGDVIDVNGRVATVEAITIRATTLRDFNGYVHFVPNGEMRMVTNRSRGWQRLAVDIPVGVDQDLDHAIAISRDVAVAMSADPEWRPRLLDPIEMWGIEALGPTEAMIRLVLRAAPGPDAPEAARELRRRARAALLESGIRSGQSREISIQPLGAERDSMITPAAAAGA